MDFFEKLNELHANEVSLKMSKDVEEVNKEEVLQKVMDFVDKFDTEQRRIPKIKPVKFGLLKPAARPYMRAASKPAARTLENYTSRLVEALRAAGRNSKTGKYSRAVKMVDPEKYVKGIGISGIQIVEGMTGKVKGKGKKVMPKLAKGQKRMKGGSGLIGGPK